MTDSQINADSRTLAWPAWMRTLSGLGALGTIAYGICIATVPDFEVRHARYVTFQLAELAIPCQLFREILRRIERLRPPTVLLDSE